DKKSPIPARVGLSLMGWKPKTQAEYALEYLEVDFENAKNAELTPFQGIIEKGKDFFLTDERGMWSIYEELYTSFKDKIKLNTTVTGIKYNSSMVEVTTSDGEVYTADYALCTFSTGVLASDMVTFTPPLPEWKQEAILTMPMAVYTTIYVKFPTKFWDDKEIILYAGPTRQSIAVFQDLQRPGIYPNNSGLLLITVTGDEGRRIEKQSLEDTKAEMFKMLKGVYGPNISEPTDIYSPRWTQNKFVRGCYSEGTVGMTSKTFENLAKNLGNLYFSGEANNEEWYSYMQGAYFTGENQAKSIVKANHCKEKPQNCTVSGTDSFRACSPVVSTTIMSIWLLQMFIG
ncbi:polyamine oxidase 1, partial [Exaiptasia diaphana]|uniref:Amine oxidase domain-containing protein n=1 Tax=Exaiptasia diaphana TaxID=2652724 RepID=A0A913YIH3_EXADI